MASAPSTDRRLDGGWDAKAAMAALAACDPREVGWTHKRVKELTRLKYGKDEIVRIISNEARSRPWEK